MNTFVAPPPSQIAAPPPSQSGGYTRIFDKYSPDPTNPDPIGIIIVFNATNGDYYAYFYDIYKKHGVADAGHDNLSGRGGKEAKSKSSNDKIKELIWITNYGGRTRMYNGSHYYDFNSSVHSLHEMLDRVIYNNDIFTDLFSLTNFLPPILKKDYMVTQAQGATPAPGYSYYFKNYKIPKDVITGVFSKSSRNYKTHGENIANYTRIQSGFQTLPPLPPTRQSTGYVEDSGQKKLHASITTNKMDAPDSQKLSGILDSSSSSGKPDNNSKFCIPFMYIFESVNVPKGVIMYGAQGTGSKNVKVFFKYYNGDIRNQTTMQTINSKVAGTDNPFTNNPSSHGWVTETINEVPTLPDILKYMAFSSCITDCLKKVFFFGSTDESAASKCKDFVRIANNIWVSLPPSRWKNKDDFIKAFLMCVKKNGDIVRLLDNELNYHIDRKNTLTGTTDSFLTNFACLTNLSVCYSNDGHTMVINDPSRDPGEVEQRRIEQDKLENDKIAAIKIFYRAQRTNKKLQQDINTNFINFFTWLNVNIRPTLFNFITDKMRMARVFSSLLNVSYFVTINEGKPKKYSYHQLYLIWLVFKIVKDGDTTKNEYIDFLLNLSNKIWKYDDATNSVNFVSPSVNDDDSLLYEVMYKLNTNEKHDDLKESINHDSKLTNIIIEYAIKLLAVPDEELNKEFKTDLYNKLDLVSNVKIDITQHGGGGYIPLWQKRQQERRNKQNEQRIAKKVGNSQVARDYEKIFKRHIEGICKNIDTLHINYFNNYKNPSLLVNIDTEDEKYENELIKLKIELLFNLFKYKDKINSKEKFVVITLLDEDNNDESEIDLIKVVETVITLFDDSIYHHYKDGKDKDIFEYYLEQKRPPSPSPPSSSPAYNSYQLQARPTKTGVGLFGSTPVFVGGKKTKNNKKQKNKRTKKKQNKNKTKKAESKK